MKLFIGLAVSFFIVLAAYKKRALSISGAFGAVVLGTLLYYFGGIYLSTLMISFFVSSSVLTKFRHITKQTLEDIHEKIGGRDLIQVAANGAIGLFFAFLFYTTKNEAYLLAFTVSFAAANSDTWSSEIGVLSKGTPISILTFKPVVRGQSGGISLLGTAAAFFGSFFIAAVFLFGYILSYGWSSHLPLDFMIIGISGFVGSLIDSILGASIQASYQCTLCNKITEKKLHHGKQTIRVKGWYWVNNDIVNFISILLASLLVFFLSFL